MNPTTLITGGAGFIGSHLCERLVGAGHEVLCVDNFHTGSKDNIRHLLGSNRFELIRHDVWLPLYRGSRPHLQPGLPGQPHSLPDQSGIHGQDLGAGRHQYAGAGQTPAGEDFAGFHLRSVWRPARASPGGNLLGTRQSHRPPRLLRRGQALRRNPVFRLPPPARGGYPRGTYFQYLRPPHASSGRAGGFQLHRPGACRRTARPLWRRQPEPIVLLRG